MQFTAQKEGEIAVLLSEFGQYPREISNAGLDFCFYQLIIVCFEIPE